VVSQQEYDTVVADANESKARLDNAEATLSYTKIRAPFDGAIARRFKYPGDMISTETRSSQQSPIFILINESELRVAVNVPQSDAASVVVGHPATVRVDSVPGKDFHGEVSRVDALLDPATKTERVLIDLKNPDGDLHAGAFATVRLELLHRDHALLVPREAVFQQGDKSHVYRLVAGHAKDTEVQTGYADTMSIELTSGVHEGEQVILPASVPIADGMEVTPQPREAKAKAG
jgi:membrane fusion protein (multidrug efflux system)